MVVVEVGGNGVDLNNREEKDRRKKRNCGVTT
jgi:hypothetical protein